MVKPFVTVNPFSIAPDLSRTHLIAPGPQPRPSSTSTHAGAPTMKVFPAPSVEISLTPAFTITRFVCEALDSVDSIEPRSYRPGSAYTTSEP